MTNTTFPWFTQTLHHRRAYRCHGEYAAWRFDWMKQWNLHELIAGGTTDGDDADFTFAGTHQMHPGNPLGLARVNERFNITLPPDLDAFHRQWDGGVLLFREIYPILSVEQMLEVNEWHVKRTAWDRRHPWPLIRFCDMSNGDYLALRQPPGRPWQINFLSREAPDEQFLSDWDREHRGSFLDDSFTHWLQRMIHTDGWPVGFQSLYETDIIPPTQRID